MEKIDLLQAENIPEPVIETEETKVHPLLQAFNELKEEGIVESLEIDIEEEIAYHGTVDDIQQFHPFTHFGTEKAAKDRMEYKKIKDGKIYKVDLDIKNPLTIKDFPGIHYDRLYAFELKDKRLISQEEMEEITFTQDPKELRNKLLNKLNELGIDGFVYKNKYEDKGNISYVIVDPSQVKVLSVEPAAEVVPEAIDRVKGGWKHHGLGYRQDPKTWEYPVHPLPKWHKFSSYNRNEKGSWEDIIHYMIFTINDYATYSLDLTGDEIAKTICKLHGTNPNEELKKANIFYRRSKDPLSWSEIYTALKENTVEQDVKRLQREGLDEASPDTLEGSFTPDLVESKTWLAKMLAKGLKGKNAGTIYVLGSWYGNMGVFLQQAGVKFDKLVLVEPDEEALMRSKDLLQQLNDDGKLILIHQKAEDIVYEKPCVVINTSCNETGPVFLTKLPDNVLCCLQARNNNEDSLFPTEQMEDFVDYFPLETVYYTGEKQLEDPEINYTRFMKIGRTGKKLDETISTGQGGGSAGSSGGQMVGGPTTYEQEYGMFKSKGPRRITAMTNEDETLTELMTQSYKWYNYEPNSYYFDNAQGDECVVYFEGNGADHVEVSFVVDSFTNITGKGDSFKIISTVVNIIKDYLTKNNPKTLTFAADNAEPSRVKLYSALVTKLAQAVPGYKLNKPTRERFDTYYTISRKNSKSVSEALDSSYPYEESSAGKYHFITDNGVKYKVYLQGKDMVEVAFSAILPGEEENFRPDKTTLTGTGDSRKVFGTVVKIVKEYLDTHKPNALYFTAENAEPSRVKLYNRLIAQVDKELPDYKALGNIDLGTSTAYMLKRKQAEPVTESTETTTLDTIYHGMRPDHDEMIWNYVGDSDFDIEFPIQKINPTMLRIYLASQYRVEDLEELFDMMDEDQEILVNHYMKEPNLSNEIIVMYDGKVIDGNHRALAAALTNKPIRYIDIGEEEL